VITKKILNFNFIGRIYKYYANDPMNLNKRFIGIERMNIL